QFVLLLHLKDRSDHPAHCKSKQSGKKFLANTFFSNARCPRSKIVGRHLSTVVGDCNEFV
ncbi:hypothetical protein NGA_0450100, partial [Nannochloropsis gaditana CCMP526]|uniref:uncharacterized protein n=1 Tax=Nannochloropsis gaditana (strain CCMP526) TaxID=1093141 RepID=UPI00029F65B9